MRPFDQLADGDQHLVGEVLAAEHAVAGREHEVAPGQILAEGAGGDPHRAHQLGPGVGGEVDAAAADPADRRGPAVGGEHAVADAQGLDAALAARRRDEGAGGEALLRAGGAGRARGTRAAGGSGRAGGAGAARGTRRPRDAAGAGRACSPCAAGGARGSSCSRAAGGARGGDACRVADRAASAKPGRRTPRPGRCRGSPARFRPLSRYAPMAGSCVAVPRHRPSFVSPYPDFGRAACQGTRHGRNEIAQPEQRLDEKVPTP